MFLTSQHCKLVVPILQNEAEAYIQYTVSLSLLSCNVVGHKPLKDDVLVTTNRGLITKYSVVSRSLMLKQSQIVVTGFEAFLPAPPPPHSPPSDVKVRS